MSRPGTYHFIGPLNEAQRRRRERNRESFRLADEIAYARNIPMSDALKAASYERIHPWEASYRYAAGEYP